MSKIIRNAVLAAVLVLVTGQARAAETLADSVKKNCHKELTTFCKGVPAGEGRILACLYAFQDQVSDQCVYALYDAADQIESAIVAVKYAAKECKGDFQKFCSEVKVGEGRGLACLSKNDKNVSQPCKDALKQTGLKK